MHDWDGARRPLRDNVPAWRRNGMYPAAMRRIRQDWPLGGGGEGVCLARLGWPTVDGQSSVAIAPAEHAASPWTDRLDMRQPCWDGSSWAVRQFVVLAHEAINARTSRLSPLAPSSSCPPPTGDGPQACPLLLTAHPLPTAAHRTMGNTC